jgi:hypothetical protein
MRDTGLTVADYATIVAGLVAVLALLDYTRRVLTRTVGRRLDVARRFARFGTGAQLQFFESILGEPPAIRRSFECEQPDWGTVENDDDEPLMVKRSYVECFWIDPLFYVQTVSDDDGTVLGFSITTRRRRFHPTIHFPLPPPWRERLLRALSLGRRQPYWLARIELGRTTFAKSLRDDWGFPVIRSWLGTRAYSYTEIHYLGNPGNYQHLALTISSAAPALGGYPDQIQNVEPGDDDPWLEVGEDGPEDWVDAAPDWIRDLHAHGVVTTVTIILGFPLENWPTFGPHGDEVRTIP